MALTLSISRSRYLLIEISDVKELKTNEGLEMWSEDVGGPYKNFNAAINTGLNKFLIPNNKDKYVWMDTERARSCYDPKTKTIGPEKLAVFGKRWWFCDEIKGSFPKFPNLKRCKLSR